MELEVDLIVK